MRFLYVSTLVFVLTQSYSQIYQPRFDVQGHRGCRGLKPENTIPAFLMALDSGVTTLELDVAITKDRQVVVSHEPWMSYKICLDPEGNPIKAKDSLKYNLFKMTYEEIHQWDCGSAGNADFPEQEKMKVGKPLLIDVILAVENHIKNFTKYEVDYNIEIKTSPRSDGKFHPKPAEFSELVYNLVDQYIPMDRVVFQSFDFRVLKYLHAKYPELRLAALVDNKKGVNGNVKLLGFAPAIYSPNYKLLTNVAVNRCHQLKMKVIPWTVNEETEMINLKGMGVDGFITDYPDRARQYKMTLSIERK